MSETLAVGTGTGAELPSPFGALAVVPVVTLLDPPPPPPPQAAISSVISTRLNRLQGGRRELGTKHTVSEEKCAHGRKVRPAKCAAL